MGSIAPYSAFLGHTIKVIDGTSPYCGTEGQVERLYWREEALWIRMRSLTGEWLSLPCRETDLPQVIAVAFPAAPHLSAPVLLKLVRHLQRRGQRRLSQTGKRTSAV